MLCSKHYCWHSVGFVMWWHLLYSNGCNGQGDTSYVTSQDRLFAYVITTIRGAGYGLQWSLSSRQNCGCYAICAIHTCVYRTRELGDGRATSCSAGVMCQERVLRREIHAKDGTYARIGSPMFHCLRWLPEQLGACKSAKIGLETCWSYFPFQFHMVLNWGPLLSVSIKGNPGHSTVLQYKFHHLYTIILFNI